MLKRLAIVALLFLYGLTGSAAAFADDGDCSHRPAAPGSLQVTLDDGATQRPADQGHSCTGLCHLLSVAQLHGETDLPARPLVGHAVPMTCTARWSAHTEGVPTPPPNVVSRLS